MPGPAKTLPDDPFLNNVERMEPQLWNGWSDTCGPADISIAISLRRIADTLEEMLVIQQADRQQ